jgi:hypothetical protein
LDWRVNDVVEFAGELETKFFGKHDGSISLTFKKNAITGQVLFGMTEEKLDKIGVPALGTRELIIYEIQILVG